MVSVRRGKHLLVRSNECGDPACEGLSSLRLSPVTRIRVGR